MTTTIEVGYPDTIKTYATVERCRKAVDELVSKLKGGCSVRIVPVEVKGSIRYTATFCCFRDLQEAVWVSWQRFMASN